jgi:3-oxoacyl-[acyl-carrier protein] reductase
MAWTRWSEIGYAARLVTVNAVAPSLIETDMMKGQDNLVSRIPLGLGKGGRGRDRRDDADWQSLHDRPDAMSGGMAFN